MLSIMNLIRMLLNCTRSFLQKFLPFGVVLWTYFAQHVEYWNENGVKMKATYVVNVTPIDEENKESFWNGHRGNPSKKVTKITLMDNWVIITWSRYKQFYISLIKTDSERELRDYRSLFWFFHIKIKFLKKIWVISSCFCEFTVQKD